MPKPSEGDLLLKRSIAHWHIHGNTYILVENTGSGGGYNCRVFPDSYEDSYWLPNGPFETESGAAWMILNYLDDRVE